MFRFSSGAFVLAAALAAGFPVWAAAATGGTVVYSAPLRVCADPDNLPYSNRKGEGFENKLAEMLAASLGTTLEYAWFPQRTGYLRPLDAGECDVVMGLPMVDGAEMTVSYYRSDYVFVSRADRNLTMSRMDDAALHALKIGVHIVGGDGAGTPPAVALGDQGIIDHVIGFPIFGSGVPAAAPVGAVARGDLDLAAIWGPIGGYYARQSDVPMRVTPITDTEQYLPEIFEFPIAMAVRQGDDDLRDRLDAFIRMHRHDIRSLLDSYGVPQLQ